MMNDRRKSDRPVVAAKSSNKATEVAAERMERRGLAKGKTPRQHTNRTLDRINVQSALGRIRQAAVKESFHGRRAPLQCPHGEVVLDRSGARLLGRHM
jgi:hypothetical protein